MAPDLTTTSHSVVDVMARLGIVLDGDPSAASRSGSGVVTGQLEGTSVVVKTTSLDSVVHQERAARELAFLQQWSSRVAVRTPRLLRAVVEHDLVVLVLERRWPCPPVDSWDEARWLSVVDLLAALHAGPAPTGPGWRRPPAALLDLDHPLVREFLPDDADRTLLARVFDQGALAARADLEPCLVHGDAHADNLLLDRDGELVLADWQEWGRGDPAADLAFLIARSWPVGGRPPVETMLARYATRRSIDVGRVRLAVAAHELQVVALQYPEYLPHLTPQGVVRLRRRFRALARQWLEAH